MPEPNKMKGEVKVRVSCCAVNHLDVWVRNGLPGRRILFPHILGSDISGTLLDEFGKFKKGEKVVIYPAISSDSKRTLYSIIGGFSQYQGGYAEIISVPKTNILKKPAWLSDEEASCINVSYLTAWNMIEKSGCKKGDTILIWGSNSGIGSASILLAKALGLSVITVASNKSKYNFAENLGADFTIDRNKADVATEVLKYTKEVGVNCVIDHVGSKTWPISIEVLKVKGRMIACGTTSGAEALVDIRSFYSKEAQIVGAYLGSKQQLISLLEFMKSKKIKPIIDSVYDLKNAKIAHQKMEEHNQRGKLILRVSNL